MTEQPTDDSPCCSQCGYILFGLPGVRCPECGTEFAPQLTTDARLYTSLLAWERPGLGGRFRRFWLTCWACWRHPIAYFNAARHRTLTPIAHPWALIGWSLLIAGAIHIAWYTLSTSLAFLRFAWAAGDLSRAADTIVKFLRNTVGTDAWLLIIQVIPVAILVLLASAALAKRSQQQEWRLGRRSMLALLSPIIVGAQLLYVLNILLSTVTYRGTVSWMFKVHMALGFLQQVYISLLVAIAFRAFLSLRKRTTLLVAVGSYLAFGLVSYAFWWILSLRLAASA